MVVNQDYDGEMKTFTLAQYALNVFKVNNYMFPLRFFHCKFLINLRRQFRVRKNFSYTTFCGI